MSTVEEAGCDSECSSNPLVEFSSLVASKLKARFLLGVQKDQRRRTKKLKMGIQSP